MKCVKCINFVAAFECSLILIKMKYWNNKLRNKGYAMLNANAVH